MLAIVQHPDVAVDHLVSWAKFHNIPYTVVSTPSEVTYEGLVIYITSDLYPTPSLIATLLNGVSEGVGELAYRPHQRQWRKSYCIFTGICGADVEIFVDAPDSRLRYVPGVCVDRRLAKKSGDLMWDAAYQQSEESRCDLLYQMMLKYWYSHGQFIVSRYYLHLWTNAVQLRSIRAGITYDANIVSELRKQSVFGTAIRHTVSDVNSIDEVIAYLELGISLEDAISDTHSGISVSRDLFPDGDEHDHILSVNGKVVLHSPEQDRCEGETTVVSMYYNLGYSDKPQDVYIESIRKFALIPHRLVFYSTEEVCELVEELRTGLETKTVVRSIEEWKLIRENQSVFEDTTTSKGMKGSGKYALMTWLKVYAMQETISSAGAHSSAGGDNTGLFAWLDCGIFRHPHIAHESIVGKRLYENAHQSTVAGKITIPSLSSFPGSTEEEFERGEEYVIAITMFGDASAWKTFCRKFDIFVDACLKDGIVWTEQVMITRLLGIFPSLAHPVFYGYNRSMFEKVLCLQ